MNSLTRVLCRQRRRRTAPRAPSGAPRPWSRRRARRRRPGPAGWAPPARACRAGCCPGSRAPRAGSGRAPRPTTRGGTQRRRRVGPQRTHPVHGRPAGPGRGTRRTGCTPAGAASARPRPAARRSPSGGRPSAPAAGRGGPAPRRTPTAATPRAPRGCAAATTGPAHRQQPRAERRGPAVGPRQRAVAEGRHRDAARLRQQPDAVAQPVAQHRVDRVRGRAPARQVGDPVRPPHRRTARRRPSRSLAARAGRAELGELPSSRSPS